MYNCEDIFGATMIYTLQKKQNTFYIHLFLGLISALLFSAFIYFEQYGTTHKLINTVSALSSITLLLYIPKRAVLFAGFFIGLFWFYWIGYSFEYNGVGYLTPFVTFGFAIIYMLFFGVLALNNDPVLRAILLFALSFFEPFDFNWMQIELLFVNSYIGIFKYQLAITLLALSLPAYLKGSYKFSPLILLILAINYATPMQYDAPLKIKLIQSNIKQEKKWRPELANEIVQYNLDEITKAKNEGYDLVVLPESCFPLFMNENHELITILKNLSKNINIIAGALLREETNHYNVTYYFHEGEYEIAKKMVLVPFGEYVPLPKFAQDWINNTFFSGEADFKTATSPTDFTIKGVKFRNAICYEATCQELYEGEIKYMLATSNNAWFAPSIEPVLQKLLMEFYARKNGVTIYHSANWRGTGVIK